MRLGWALQVGEVALTCLELSSKKQKVAGLLYWTVKEERRRGLAVQAVTAVITWGFNELGLDKVEWRAEVRVGRVHQRGAIISESHIWPDDLGLIIEQNVTLQDTDAVCELPEKM